jgi:hypothetical protein
MKDIGVLPEIMVLLLPTDIKAQRIDHHLGSALKARLSIGNWRRVAVFELEDMDGLSSAAEKTLNKY